MIVSAILYLMYGVIWTLTLPIASLQDATLPSWVSSAISNINGFIASLNGVMPITTSTLMAVIGLMITIELGVFAYKLIMWAIRRIPGQG